MTTISSVCALLLPTAHHAFNFTPSLPSLADLQALQHRTLKQKQMLEYNFFSQTWVKVLGIYLLVQAILGIIAVEYAWCRTKRFREKNEQRDARFGPFRRYDAEKWSRWKFYPGAMFLMPTRAILLILDAMFLAVVVSLLAIGHDFKKGPMKNGCRKWTIFFMYHVCCWFYLFVAGMRSSLCYKDVDYSYYLGPDYKSNMKKIKRTSTIVSNHVSWLDPVILIKHVRPAFAPSEEFRGAPLVGTLASCIDSIYIPRGGSRESKDKALQAIRDRQELIEQTGSYAPFLIFPEGTTSNGTSILKMKQGAFFAEKTVRPMFMKYKIGTVSPAFDIMEFVPLAILQLSWAGFNCKVTVLPDFQPNEYLFETHKSQGKERWEIIAWAIQDIICKEGSFNKSNITVRQKNEYEDFMQMKPNAKNPDQIDLERISLLNSDASSPLLLQQYDSGNKEHSDEEMQLNIKKEEYSNELLDQHQEMVRFRKTTKQ